MKPEQLVRQYDILPPSKTEKIIAVIGAGAIGSQVVMCLAKMGFDNIRVFDDDVVSEENISNQWFGEIDIGFKKVDALAEHACRMAMTMPASYPVRVTEDAGDLAAVELIISAVDSMEARKVIYERAQTTSTVTHLIDPRMSAESGAIYVVDMMDKSSREAYESFLHTDGEAIQEPCTAKATMYCSMVLAGLTCGIVKDVVTGNKLVKSLMISMKNLDVMVFR